MMAHYVARLPEGVAVESLGEDWRGQVREVREARLAPWRGPPDWLRDRPHVQADWGTLICQLSADDLARLIGEEAAPGRYIAVWVECY